MHWCYLPELPQQEEERPAQWELSGEEAHHALKVMRLREGDSCALFNGRGSVVKARIISTNGSKSCWLEIEETLPSPSESLPELTLALSIPKGGNMELIIQKAVELGISHIQPLLSEHCVVKLKEKDIPTKQEKWQRIALEACKQCKNPHLPRVAAALPLKQFLQQAEQQGNKVCCALVESARPIRESLESLRSTGSRQLTLLIGPEGDFSSTEYAEILAAGYAPVSLGSLILRVETAVFMALSSARYALS